MKFKWIGVAAVLAITFGAGAAKADDIHICATPAACTGNPSGLQPSGSTTAYIYGKTFAPTPDQLWVLQLAPVASGGNWSSNSVTVWSVLGETLNATFNDTFPNLNSALSQLSTVGFSGSGFQVQDFLINPNWTGAQDTNPTSFTLPGNPAAGDAYLVFVENSLDQVVAVSPWSSAVVFTPEPGTLLLLAIGLVGVFAFRRRLGITQVS